MAPVYSGIALLILGLSWAGASEGETGANSKRPEVPARDSGAELGKRLHQAGITLGEGTGRILVAPAPGRGTVQAEAMQDLVLHDSVEVAEANPFLPRTLTQGPLKTRLDVEEEVERVKVSRGDDSPHVRAPSSALLSMLRENQRQAPATGSGPGGVALRGRAAGVSGGAGAEGKPGEGERFELFALARRKKSKEGEGTAASLVVFDRSPEFEFASVRGASVPFHVFDVNPAETILVELSGDDLARVKRQGKDWAWIQLDSGLMGLVRNHHVKAASEYEILKYLALEYGKMKEEGLIPSEGGGPVRVNLVNGAYEVTGTVGRDLPVPEMGVKIPETGEKERVKPEAKR